MKTKVIPLILLSSAAFFVGFIALTYISRDDLPSVSAGQLPNNLATPTPYTTSIPGVSAQILEKFTDTEIMTQQVNGVEMSVANFRSVKNDFYVDVCFQMPDDNDWIYQEVKIQFGNVEIPPYESTRFESISTLPNGQRILTTFLGDPPQLVSENIEAKDLPDYRCDTLGFHIGAEMIEADVTLYIGSIGSTPREGEGCAATRDKVQSILDANDTEIQIDCVQQESGSTTFITSKPGAISQEDAEALVSKAFREVFTIKGPWIFTGSIK